MCLLPFCILIGLLSLSRLSKNQSHFRRDTSPPLACVNVWCLEKPLAWIGSYVSVRVPPVSCGYRCREPPPGYECGANGSCVLGLSLLRFGFLTVTHSSLLFVTTTRGSVFVGAFIDFHVQCVHFDVDSDNDVDLLLTCDCPSSSAGRCRWLQKFIYFCPGRGVRQ